MLAGVTWIQQIALLCLLYLTVDIAGSGDPLYVAELCKWHFYGQTRSIGLVLFAKIVFFMHEEDQDQLNREKGMEQPQKEQFFLRPLCYFLSLA